MFVDARRLRNMLMRMRKESGRGKAAWTTDLPIVPVNTVELSHSVVDNLIQARVDATARDADGPRRQAPILFQMCGMGHGASVCGAARFRFHDIGSVA